MGKNTWLECLLALGLATALPAKAEPVSLLDVKAEHEKLKTSNILLGVLYGTPTMRGMIDRKTFDAVLLGCTMDRKDCGAIRYETCGPYLEQPRGELLEIANDYNQRIYYGTAFVLDTKGGQSLCLKMRRDFGRDFSFTSEIIYEWRTAMDDFLNFHEDRTGVPGRRQHETEAADGAE